MQSQIENKNNDSSNCNKRVLLDQIQNIHQDDLTFLEKDLSYNEKVSLGFLLFARTKGNTLFILQKLLALYENSNLSTDIWLNHTRENKKNWRFCLVEGLAIIKAHRVLRKLGINKYEYEITFLPYTPEVGLYIHPVLKALYLVCESLSLSEAKSLIFETRKQTNRYDFNFKDTSFLEIFLMEWMTQDLICVGQWPETNENTRANQNIIINFLKRYEKDYLKRVVENACKYVNSRIDDKKLIGSSNAIILHEIKSQISNIEFQNDIDNNTKENIYKIEKATAGFVLIINQYKFYFDEDPELKDLLPISPLIERKGTAQDATSLRETFSKFGYRIEEKNDLTHNQIIATIRNFVKLSRHYDSFILCILSHGSEGVIYGTNSVPVKILEIEDILASSSELFEKPKVLIIQACQGTQLNINGPIEEVSPNEPLPEYYITKKIDPNSSRINKSHKPVDMLIVTSTVMGYMSIRDMGSGSWFIQTLCKNINTYAKSQHLLDITTTVIQEVSQKKNSRNYSMIPEVKSTLRKNILFPKIS